MNGQANAQKIGLWLPARTRDLLPESAGYFPRPMNRRSLDTVDDCGGLANDPFPLTPALSLGERESKTSTPGSTRFKVSVHVPAYAVLGFCVAFAWVATSDVMAQSEKRVLIVHSFGSAAPPFTTHSIAFETELTEGMGERLDLDEVSLDHARYADPEMQEALVAYLEKRQAK